MPEQTGRLDSFPEKLNPAFLGITCRRGSRLDPLFGLFLMFLPYAGYRTWQGRHDGAVLPPTSAVRSTVNPNTAPWWELTVLPGIGPTKAIDIVRYRESIQNDRSVLPTPTFRRSEDLDLIRGIGPKTIMRIRDELRFAD
ncbi:MAG: helix-hairpin-helix domain-containing protein [Planctomycetota bacterium]